MGSLELSNMSARDTCFKNVTALFPDICPDFIETIAAPLAHSPSAVIEYIICLLEDGKSYIKRAQRSSLKRKRKDEEEESDGISRDEVFQAQRKYCHPSRPEGPKDDVLIMKKLISADFPLVRVKSVQNAIAENGQNLAPAYIALTKLFDAEEGEENFQLTKTRSSPVDQRYNPANLAKTIRTCQNPKEKEMLEELFAARLMRSVWKATKGEEKMAREVERENLEKAIAKGDIKDCECCFGEFPTNRLVQCNADSCHWFCYDCARRNAETVVGLLKYELTCMSTDGCAGGFSQAQRSNFIDEKLQKALDKIEKDAILEQAGIKNLAKCPFCSYAAECPPAQVDKEFRCHDPECMIVSCRLCQLESHSPLTCDEAAKETGVSARREIEEAMTAALIRKCNSCGAPFIKEFGCNKMKCPKPTCGNIQCYVCSKSCDYAHFNDLHRGGKKGNCPLFDVTESRHENEIQAAQKAAKKKMAEKYPDMDLELLDIKMSSKVAEDDKRRNDNDPYVNQNQLFINGRRIVPAPVIDPNHPPQNLAQVNIQALEQQIAVLQADINQQQRALQQAQLRPGFRDIFQPFLHGQRAQNAEANPIDRLMDQLDLLALLLQRARNAQRGNQPVNPHPQAQMQQVLAQARQIQAQAQAAPVPHAIPNDQALHNAIRNRDLDLARRAQQAQQALPQQALPQQAPPRQPLPRQQVAALRPQQPAQRGREDRLNENNMVDMVAILPLRQRVPLGQWQPGQPQQQDIPQNQQNQHPPRRSMRNNGWMRRLREIDVGFGPMQDIRFERAFVKNPGNMHQGHPQNQAAPAPAPQAAEPAVQNPAAQNQQPHGRRQPNGRG